MSTPAIGRLVPPARSEGYVVNPYQTATAKHRFRWLCGIVAPRAPHVEGSEPWFTETMCLVEASERAQLTARLRFLQIEERAIEEVDPVRGQSRRVQRLEVDGRELVTWEQGLLHTKTTGLPLRPGQPATVLSVDAAGSRTVEHIADAQGFIRARWVRTCQPLTGELKLKVDAVHEYLRVTVRFENLAAWQPEFELSRAALLSRSFVSAHLVLGAERAQFVSLLDPPQSALQAASSCRSTHIHPVLVGNKDRRDLLLSAPLCFRDYPPIGLPGHGDPSAVEEFNEVLSLRIMTMTDADVPSSATKYPA